MGEEPEVDGRGAPIGLNLVEGFVGAPECALFVGDQTLPLGEGRFEYDARRPLSPWRVRTECGAVELAFAPGAMHAERRDLGLVRARFVQPVGAFTGTIAAGGRTYELRDVLGVVEDQDVRW